LGAWLCCLWRAETDRQHACRAFGRVRHIAFDPETHHLFEESNFDPYDGDRYAPVLKAGLAQHGLDLSDVLAVTEGFGVWAICRPGIFEASLRGVVRKRIEIGKLIPFSQVTSIREEPSGPKTMRIVLMGGGSTELAQIDFGAGGMENTPEIAAAHRSRIYRILEQARARAED
jgi:hypothetical protein